MGKEPHMDMAARRLHLIDVENLIGDRHVVASDAEVRAVIQQWLHHVGRRPADHVVLACHPALGLAAGQAIDGGQLVVAHGKDGADHALLTWAPIDHVAARYSRVVIGSGDGIFAMFARSLRLRGVNVHVCTRKGAMSASLRRAIGGTPDVGASSCVVAAEAAAELSA